MIFLLILLLLIIAILSFIIWWLLNENQEYREFYKHQFDENNINENFEKYLGI